jgi:hypothetical protein
MYLKQKNKLTNNFNNLKTSKMGVGTNNGGNILYLTVSKGFLVNKGKNIEAHTYEGVLESIEKKEDEYQGQPIEKIILKMRDKDETAIIQFTAESWFTQSFFARAEKIDLSKPFILGVSTSDQNEKMSFAWVKQGGEIVKKDETFPKPNKVKAGKKDVTDWTPVMEKVDEIIAKMNSLDMSPSPQIVHQDKPQSTPMPVDDNDEVDQLPF